MNERREEQELEAYLAGDSAVSRRYAELPSAQPPPELDARIIAAAEAETKLVPLRRPWQRWTAAVGVAATVMLAFTLVMQLVIAPNGQPVPGAPPAAVVLMDDAGLERARVPAKRAAPMAGATAESADAPVDSAGRAARAEKSELREERVPAARQADLAGSGSVSLSTPAEPAPGNSAAGTAPGSGPAGAATARLARAVAVIREFGAATAARETVQPAAVASRAATAGADGDEADAVNAATQQRQLDEVLRLYAAGDFSAAATLLDEFLAEWPQHPVSRRLADTLD